MKSHNSQNLITVKTLQHQNHTRIQTLQKTKSNSYNSLKQQHLTTVITLETLTIKNLTTVKTLHQPKPYNNRTLIQ